MNALVSIIIPAYNSDRWIRETIESSIAQTWSRKEIIIVNDGSNDTTYQIANTYESKNVKVVSQENQGASAARNKGLESAQGDYIQWLDADDLLAPDKIEKQLLAVESNRDSRILLTASWGKFYYSLNRAKFERDSLWNDWNPADWIISKFNENIWMNPAVWLVSRKLTDLAGPWNSKCEPDDDGEYICRIIAQSERVKFIHEAKCYYRKSNPKSLSKDPSEKQLKNIFYSHSLCIKHLLSIENSDRSRKACINLLQQSLYRYYPNHPSIIKEAEQLAEKLGGRLETPKLNWKYSTIKKLLGNDISEKIKRTKAMINAEISRKLDKIIYDIENKKKEI